jgi:hypothetical protein
MRFLPFHRNEVGIHASSVAAGGMICLHPGGMNFAGKVLFVCGGAEE